MRRVYITLLWLIAVLALQPSFVFAQRVDSSATQSAILKSGAAPAATNFRPLAEQITAEQLKAYLYFIASDELEGRDTPSRGLNIAAKFIATNLTRWGLKPAGDNGTFFQKIDLSRTKIDLISTKVELNGRAFQAGSDFIPKNVPGNISGSMVFAGHGWMVKAKNIDPYAGIDVKNKIVIITGEARPHIITNHDLSGQRGVDWDSPLGYATSHGASALIIVPDQQDLIDWDRQAKALGRGGSLTVNKLHKPSTSKLPVIIASTELTKAIFAGEKVNGPEVFQRVGTNSAPASFQLDPQKQLNLNIQLNTEKLETQNVVAVIEGSDPVLKNEYVALGAHYDHVGIGAAVDGDSIYNGADDDGSGTCALLAIAETLAHNQRPQRSILFVWHAGEEKGLWGSSYFTQFPTVPLSQIITQLNVDMIGRSKKPNDNDPRNKFLSGPNEIYVIGSRMMSTELGDLNEKVNKSYLKLSYNFHYDEPNDPERLFFRSDHYNYAQKGIPIIFYFDGVHEDYHRPSDSPDKIDYQKYEKVTRSIFATAWTLANTQKRPTVNKQLPDGLKKTS